MSSITDQRWIVPVAVWLGVLAAIAALWVSGQASDAWVVIRDAQVVPLLLVVIIGMLLPIVHTMRWQAVMRAMDIDIPTVLAADVTVSSSLVNYAGPGYLGVSAKAFLANRTVRAPLSRSLLSMAFEQAVDFSVLLIGSVLAALVLGPERLSGLLPSRDPGVGTAVIVVGILVLATLVIVGRGPAKRMILRMTEATRSLGGRIDPITIGLLTFIYWVGQGCVVVLLFWSLHLPMTFEAILAVSTIPMLVAQIVPIPGGIGAREAAIVVLSSAIGGSVTGLLGFAILQRVLLVAALPLSLGVIRLARSTRLGVQA